MNLRAVDSEGTVWATTEEVVSDEWNRMMGMVVAWAATDHEITVSNFSWKAWERGEAVPGCDIERHIVEEFTRCSNCGHANGARCSECGREMLCGEVSEPCPISGCLERVIAERYGGTGADLEAGPVEKPWRVT